MRRRMSVKGAIKKTRSIAVDRKYLLHQCINSNKFQLFCILICVAESISIGNEDRRPSMISNTNPFIEITDTSVTPVPSTSERPPHERTPSPSDIFSWKHSPKPHRHKVNFEAQYADTEVEELLAMLRETESLEEQGDILQYLVGTFFLFVVNHSFISSK